MMIARLKTFVHRICDGVQVVQRQLTIAELTVFERLAHVLIHDSSKVLDRAVGHRPCVGFDAIGQKADGCLQRLRLRASVPEIGLVDVGILLTRAM